MRPRSPLRFGAAFAVVLALYQLTFPALMSAGSRAGAWGIATVLVLAGFGLAVVFTAVYDGPRALGQLLKRRRFGAAGAAGSRAGRGG